MDKKDSVKPRWGTLSRKYVTAKSAVCIVAVLLLAPMSYSAPPPKPDPFEGTVRVVSGVAEGTLATVSDVATETAKALAGLTEGTTTVFERDILSIPGLFIGKDMMSTTGVTVGVTSINIYQQNMHGGLSTHNRRGRFNGAYSLEVAADFERLFGLEGIGFYTSADGAWSKSGGINAASVGSAFGVNGEEGSRRSLDIIQAWFEGDMFDGSLRIRAGKMDIANGFDCGGQPVAFDTST